MFHTTEYIQGQNVWYNTKILFNNKPFLYKKFIKKRIIFIRDMLDDEGNLLGFEYFIHKYNINTNVIKLCIVDECCKNIFTYTIQFHYNSV